MCIVRQEQQLIKVVLWCGYRSWWRVFAPLWIIHALLMLVGAYFFVAFPDQAFKEDNLISGTGTKMNMPSIKPRYRTNFFFLLIIVLNIPVWIVRGFYLSEVKN
jgi:hypothetical protein